MIEFMSSWAEQIVLAVIIATIIEMILPQNKNKKYVQMVIGVYILFNIVSPIIKNKETFSIEKFNIQDYATVESKYTIDQSSMDKRLKKIYLEELEKTIISIIEYEEFAVVKCDIDAELDANQKNAGIHFINLKIKGRKSENEVNKIKKQLAKELEIEEEKIEIQYSKTK